MPAALAVRCTIRQTSCRSMGLPVMGLRISEFGGAFAATGLQDPQDGTVRGMVVGLVAFVDQVQHPVAMQGFGVLLDPRSRCLRGAPGR